MMDFLRIFKHLLPRAAAWNITTQKSLRKFWQSLTVIVFEFKIYADQIIHSNFYASSTEELEQWIKQFGLALTAGMSEQQKRERVAARWAELGGQSPGYLQNALQQAGFDVYVFDWWSSVGPPPVLRRPLDYLRRTYLPTETITVLCGEPLALCGEPLALCGNSNERVAYPLVNKIDVSTPTYITLCGEPLMLCGEPSAVCGDFSTIANTEKNYSIPLDSESWHYFVYIGAQIFPNLAEVPLIRKDEFETLCLRLFPTQLWLGMLVKYV